MITDIKKKIDKNTLTVEVTCAERKFLSHKIETLTTQDVLDILKKQYKIVKVITEPKHKVGNTTRRKMKPIGLWVFQLEKEKTAANNTTKRRTPQKNTKKISSRISNLAKKENKKEE